jgi:hypothetical protein
MSESGLQRAGEIVLRHLWCCVAHDLPAGGCLHAVGLTASRSDVVAALRALPADQRHAAYAFARVGPLQHHPYTSWRRLARARHSNLSALRKAAIRAAGQFYLHLLARRRHAPTP